MGERVWTGTMQFRAISCRLLPCFMSGGSTSEWPPGAQASPRRTGSALSPPMPRSGPCLRIQMIHTFSCTHIHHYKFTAAMNPTSPQAPPHKYTQNLSRA